MRRTLALTNKNMTRWCAADIRAKRWGRMSDGQMAQRSSVLEACARQGGSVRIASTSSDVNQVIAVRPAPARRSLSLRRLVVACVPIFPSACPPSCPALDLHRPCPPVRRWAVVGLVCTRRAIACRDWWRRRGGTCAGCLCSFRCTKSRWRSRSCARRIHSRCALPQCRRTAQHECLLSLRPAALLGVRCEWCAVRLSAAVCRGADDRGNPRRTTVADARTCLGPPRWPHARPPASAACTPPKHGATVWLAFDAACDFGSPTPRGGRCSTLDRRQQCGRRGRSCRSRTSSARWRSF